jgi:murein L,D-transpeptidase YcbB/YkuD
LNEPFQIALVERFRQIHKSPGALEPSGRLYLRIGPTYSNSGVSDDPPKVIETLLNRFVTKLVRYAMAAKEQRAAAEERQRRWRIHDDELRRKQQAEQSERLRLRHFRNMAALWAGRERLRQFVAVVETRIASGEIDPQIEEVAKARLAWAKAYLSGKDPVAAFITERWPEAPLRAPMQAPWSWE